ncbi:hypothetical protein HYU06_02495 [Candidatus Woesearchaeota archaeon]|nr:hypothetical protein [Candidatus Woesearchaeota archaeon]
MVKADTTLENILFVAILFVAEVSAIIIICGTVIIAAVGYSVMTSLFSQQLNKFTMQEVITWDDVKGRNRS